MAQKSMPLSRKVTKSPTRKVRVNEQQHKTRTFIEEEPIEDMDELEIEIETEVTTDPIAEFLRSIDEERSVTMHAFVLPVHPVNGKVGHVSDRAYVTSFQFTGDETETYRSRVQFCYPQGGMFQFELREGGKILKRWNEKITPAPGYEPEKKSPFPFPPPPVINIKQSEQKAEPATNPIQVLKDQFATMKEMVGIVKELMPPAPVVNVGENPNGQQQQERPLEDRLLETVLIKALESGKTPADKIFEFLSNGRNKPSGFMDSLAPVLVELAKGLTPVLSMGIQQYVRSAAQSQGAAPAAPGEPIEANPQQITAPPPEPSERAWRRVVQRMLEDCFEHVQIRRASAVDGIHTTPSANAIVDLLDRFPEQLTQTVHALLDLTPEEVFDTCAMLQPTQQIAEGVMALKSYPAALSWLKELQEETKGILAESAEGGDYENQG